jgi:hypothetical protein
MYWGPLVRPEGLRRSAEHSAAAPASDGIQLALGPFDYRLQTSGIDRTVVAVQGEEVAFRERAATNHARAPIEVDRQIGAGNQAHLAELPCHHRGM